MNPGDIITVSGERALVVSEYLVTGWGEKGPYRYTVVRTEAVNVEHAEQLAGHRAPSAHGRKV